MEKLTSIIKHINAEERDTITKIENYLISFSEITNAPITFFSIDMKPVWEYNRDIKLCVANPEYQQDDSRCRFNLMSSLKTSLDLCETYIFMCNSRMINLAHPLIMHERVLGYFIAGPISMGVNLSRTVEHIYQHIPVEVVNLPKIIGISSNMRLYNPQEVTHLANIYSSIFEPLAITGGFNDKIRQNNMDQERIFKEIASRKKDNIQLDYPVESEKELINSIHKGYEAEYHEKLYKYVEDVMVFDNADISITKIRLLSIFSQFMTTAESGLQYDWIECMDSINSASSLKELMSASSSAMEVISGIGKRNDYSGEYEVVSKALSYIHSNYISPISLTDIAENIHSNNNYLSTIFKKEIGKTVTDYIRDLRLESAEKLLTSSNASITEISLSCGFESSSYFAKQFKVKYGKTPKEYRKERNNSFEK